MIKIIDILGINDENKIVIEHNRGSLAQSKVKIEGNGTFIRELKEKEIVISQLFLGGKRCDINFNIPETIIFHNSISIPEGHKKSLAQFIEIMKKIKNPVINHPQNVLLTQRDSIPNVLSAIEGLVVPKCLKIIPESTLDVAKFMDENGFHFPVLFRPVTEPEKDMLVRIDSFEKLERLQRFAFDGINEYYVTQFVDFHSNDGLYRKIRFLVIGDEVYPRHLMLSSSWKIHTDDAIMEDEIKRRQTAAEAVFLASIEISTGHRLLAIKKVLGLDYFGVDCAIDTKGTILIFEANTFSMVGNGKNDIYHLDTIGAIYDALKRLIESKQYHYISKKDL